MKALFKKVSIPAALSFVFLMGLVWVVVKNDFFSASDQVDSDHLLVEDALMRGIEINSKPRSKPPARLRPADLGEMSTSETDAIVEQNIHRLANILGPQNQTVSQDVFSGELSKRKRTDLERFESDLSRGEKSNLVFNANRRLEGIYNSIALENASSDDPDSISASLKSSLAKRATSQRWKRRLEG